MTNNFQNLEIYNETDYPTPKIDFLKLKNTILGPHFDLTVSILLPKNSQKINKKQRNQSYTPNTLSFKYSPISGEIILTPEIIENEDYLLQDLELTSFKDKFLYLLIHSSVHLLNMDHGEQMEKLEVKYFNKFKTQTN